MEKAYRNVGFFLLLLVPMAVLGFYKSYIIQSPEVNIAIDGFIHFHAAVSSVWIGLLIAQPLLIRYKQHRMHRLFGKMSYIVFPLLLLTFVALIIRSYNGLASVINPVFDVALLLIFYFLAIKNKHHVGIHMRYMIACALIFIGPTLARILYYWTSVDAFWGTMITWGSINLLLLGLIAWDKRNQRNDQPYRVALAGFFIYLVVLVVGNW